MTSIMLTGASGFIGRQCLALLKSKGYDVHAVSRKPLSTIPQCVPWHEIDLLAPTAATQLVDRIQPKLLLHLAWCATPGRFWTDPDNVLWVRASLDLLEAFTKSGGERFVVAGSCTEYDWTSGECDENSAMLKPSTLYGTSKFALGKIVESWSKISQLSYGWGRIFHLYGPFENPSRLVAYAINCLLRGEPALCSSGRQIHDFLSVEDVASALVALLESGVQGPVNIGSGIPVTVRDVLDEIARQINRGDLLRFGARGAEAETTRIWANPGRLNQEVGWSPRYDLAKGLERTIDWWRKKLAAEGLSLKVAADRAS